MEMWRVGISGCLFGAGKEEKSGWTWGVLLPEKDAWGVAMTRLRGGGWLRIEGECLRWLMKLVCVREKRKVRKRAWLQRGSLNIK